MRRRYSIKNERQFTYFVCKSSALNAILRLEIAQHSTFVHLKKHRFEVIFKIYFALMMQFVVKTEEFNEVINGN